MGFGMGVVKRLSFFEFSEEGEAENRISPLVKPKRLNFGLGEPSIGRILHRDSK